MAWTVVGLLVTLLGCAGNAFFSVKLLRRLGSLRPFQEQLRGLTFRQRRVLTYCLRHDEAIPEALRHAAAPLAEHLAGMRFVAANVGSGGLALTGMVIQPAEGLVGKLLHLYLGIVLVFVVVGVVVMARGATAGLRYLRRSPVSDGTQGAAH